MVKITNHSSIGLCNQIGYSNDVVDFVTDYINKEKDKKKVYNGTY